MDKNRLFQEAQAIEGKLIKYRRELHARAETGFELTKTHSYIWSQLKAMDLEPKRCGRCGIVCTVGKPGRTFLLRADMDALPLQEETALPFAAANGAMHACGHDMHAAMLLAAAQLLKKHECELSGTVKLMFQPAEETLAGAQDMIDGGVLENPSVDAALMLHVMTGQTIPTGTVIIPAPGASAPAAGTFTVHIQGKGAHGAMPHTGVDPLTAAAHTVIALQEITSRELAPPDNAALTIGSLQSGATANVIPDTALLRGSFRAFADDTFAQMRRRIEEICTGIASVFRAHARVEFHESCPTLVNDAKLTILAERCIGKMLGKEMVFSAAKLAGSSAARASGSEDFSHISHRVPSLMLALAAGHPEDGYTHPLHHPRAGFDERALAVGAAVYACTAMCWLEENH